MSYIGIARKAGTSSSNIEKLVSRGEGCSSLGNRLGVSAAEISDFVSGTASPGIAAALGTNTVSAQGLRDAIGMEGAIGLIIGLACGREGISRRETEE